MSWYKRCILVEVEPVKAHRTKKEKEQMTQFERYYEAGERGGVFVALQHAAGFHCVEE